MSGPAERGHAALTNGADGRPCVSLAGEFDVSNADDLRRALDEIPRGQPAVVDATGLRFIDSSGIAVLLQHAERFGPIDVRNAPPILRRIVEISGLDDVLRIES